MRSVCSCSNSENAMTQLNVNDPVAVLIAALTALRDGGIDAATYGGLALAAYGEPRETKDADFAVAGVSVASALEALRRGGLDVELTFERVKFGGNLVSRFTLYGSAPAGLNTIDLVEPRSPRFARLSLERALSGTIRSTQVRVLTPEDFVAYKLLSTRDRDVEDAATVLEKLASAIDRPLLEAELRLLASELPDHDLQTRWERTANLRREQ